MLRASRIIKRTVMNCSLKMSTWMFIISACLLLLCIHLCSCVWFSLTWLDDDPSAQNWINNYVGNTAGEPLEGSRRLLPGGRAVYGSGGGLDDSRADSRRRLFGLASVDVAAQAGPIGAAAGSNGNISLARILRASAAAKGGGDEDEGHPGPHLWYYVSTQYTLAIFGVWAFDTPGPANELEGWFSMIMTLIYATG
jgi:hypothetical protein